MISFQLFESKINMENEIFSAYNGRYLFDVSKAYDMIDRKRVKSFIKEYTPEMMHFLSHPEFSGADLNKVKSLKMDYSLPIGLIVNFQDPESGKTEYMLIDGNHRTRRAIMDKKVAKYHVVSDPKDSAKFLKVDKKVSHKLFADDE